MRGGLPVIVFAVLLSLSLAAGAAEAAKGGKDAKEDGGGSGASAQDGGAGGENGQGGQTGQTGQAGKDGENGQAGKTDPPDPTGKDGQTDPDGKAGGKDPGASNGTKGSSPPAEPAPPADKGKPADDGASSGGKSEDKGKAEEAGKADEKGKPQENGESDGKGKADDGGAADGKGKSDEKGKADDKGKEGEKPKSEGNGKSDDAGKSEEKGKPDDKGKAEDKGKPAGDGADRDAGLGNDKTRGGAAGGSERDRDAGTGRSAEEAALPPAPAPVVVIGSGAGVVAGAVEVEARNVAHAATQDLVLVRPDGGEEVLARNSSRASWNASAYANEWYTIELRERRADGSQQTVASTRVLVANPRATPVEAAAAVATATFVTMTAGMAASRGVDLLGLARNALLDVSTEVAEERVGSASSRFARRTRTVAAIVAAVAILAVCRTWASVTDLAAFAVALPVAGSAVALCVAGSYGAEWALARASGARPAARLWIPGAISLILSTFLFRSAFGMPAYVDELEGRERHQRVAARRAIALLSATFALALPFLAMGWLWRWDFAEVGLGVALMIAAAQSLPFRPLPGRDLWAASRLLWLGVFPVPLALWFSWQLGWLPPWALLVVAVAGAFGFAWGLRAMRAA